MPLLFYLQDGSGILLAVAVKVVDDVLIYGRRNLLECVTNNVQSKYKPGTVFFGRDRHFFWSSDFSRHELQYFN